MQHREGDRWAGMAFVGIVIYGAMCSDAPWSPFVYVVIAAALFVGILAVAASARD